MQLVISEKPSVAQSIAKVLGANQRKDGYLEGNGYLVSWCVGHLVALCDAAEYEERYEKWNYDDLPIIPQEWKHKVMKGTKKQYGILKKLMWEKSVTEIVCATDAGREGELIFRLVYHMTGCQKPFKRLWISSMEESAIRKGFQNLKDGMDYDALYESALCRAKADWLVGINASRLFSVLYSKRLSVGRVQTPTLAMIVERNQKINSFEKERFYVTHLKFGELDAVSEHFTTKEEAEQVMQDCTDRMCQVTDIDRQKKTVSAPKLYDLTTLQRECNRMFGYTAQKTLDYTQSLYEKKLVTYPRTDSQYLTEEMEESTRMLREQLLKELDLSEKVQAIPDITKVLDAKKVSDHHAIIPTMEVTAAQLEKLPLEEKNVLLMTICKLFMATADSYVYESVKCDLICNGHIFHAATKKILQEGFKREEKLFRQYFGKTAEEMPDITLSLSKAFGPMDASVSEQFTQPPKQYTEDSLLSAMERAGNEELNEETEKKGIGTPATRAGIIEKMISAGFVKREKKNLIPTDDGIALITVLPDEIKSPKMTAEWEMYLTHIANGEESADTFMEEITAMMRELVERYHGISDDEKKRFKSQHTREEIGICPRCGNLVYEGKMNFFCSEPDCEFALWKNNRYFEKLGKKLDKQTAKKLLKSRKIRYKDLVSAKSGKTYEAIICLEEPDEGVVKFKMEFPKKKTK